MEVRQITVPIYGWLSMIINDALAVRKSLNFLKKSQYWERDEINRHQNIRLRALIKNSYDNVLYYHDIFRKSNLKPDDIRTKADLHKLPLLSKDDLRNHLETMVAGNLKAKAVPSQTGGSTGEPLKFFTQRETWKWRMAAAYRAWSWCGYKPGVKMVELWGASFEITELDRVSTKVRNAILRKKTLNSFRMSDEDMANYARQIIEFNPLVLRGFTTAVYIFAKYVSENNIEGIRPKAIITTAENLYGFQRKKMEEAFGCPVYDGYGSRETSLVAHECEHRTGYHISEENSIVEFLKDGEPVSPGESGEIVITDLHNLVMPWLRYSIGDMGKFKDEKCECGRTLAQIGSINGRIHDMIVTSSGKRLPGEFFPHLFKDVNGIKEYRIVQRKIERLDVEIVKTDTFSETDLHYLMKHMKSYLGDDIEISVTYPKIINWPSSGKHRFTISEICE
jgi:phenylacetate-CoA ligase